MNFLIYYVKISNCINFFSIYRILRFTIQSYDSTDLSWSYIENNMDQNDCNQNVEPN